MWNPFKTTFSESQNNAIKRAFADHTGKYIADLRCNNCGYLAQYGIPLGTSKPDYIKVTDCPNCKCSNTLVQV